MRLLGIVVLVAALAQPALAQAPAKQPAKAAKGAKKAAPNPVAASYAALPENERVRIQQDLIWTGDYNGVATGEFGERSVAAVKAFQKRNGTRQTGVLNPQERGVLAASAKGKQDAVGWRLVEDARTGARLGLPAKLAPERAESRSGTLWKSARGEVQVETFRMRVADPKLAFEQMKKEPAERRTGYGVMRGDFFVLSGLQGLKKFYVRAHVRGEELRGITILYDQAMEGVMDPVVIAMSSAYAAFPAGVAAAPVKRRVEYATGIVVSPGGHIVTDAEATEGCYAISVPGHGGADRVAAEKGIALLRVYGTRLPKPLRLARESGAAPEAVLVGIADPEKQDGGRAVSATRVRFASANGARAVEPAPVAGFAGAAVVDAEGRLIAMVAPGAAADAPRGVLVPVETIRAVLAAQKVTPDESAARATAKDAVVRVICARK